MAVYKSPEAGDEAQLDLLIYFVTLRPCAVDFSEFMGVICFCLVLRGSSLPPIYSNFLFFTYFRPFSSLSLSFFSFLFSSSLCVGMCDVSRLCIPRLSWTFFAYIFSFCSLSLSLYHVSFFLSLYLFVRSVCMSLSVFLSSLLRICLYVIVTLHFIFLL